MTKQEAYKYIYEYVDINGDPYGDYEAFCKAMECVKMLRPEPDQENGIVDCGCGNDPVNHPAHYTSSGIEVLDAIEAWGLPYHLGNVVKYVARAGKKNKDTYSEDLRKAQFYLNRYIKNLGERSHE